MRSSCDDTSAAGTARRDAAGHVMASQEVHRKYGGVVPELASRAHQQNIVPVVSQALDQAGVRPDQIDAIAYTRGPGLLGSLLVGGVPLPKDCHWRQVSRWWMSTPPGPHPLAFIRQEGKSYVPPTFPFLALLVSGGHSQIVRVDDPLHFEVLGRTIDDAVGEAFDKCGQALGLGLSRRSGGGQASCPGRPGAIQVRQAARPGLDYSFSGVKTSLLYLCVTI